MTRKFTAPLKSSAPGDVLPVAVTSSYTILSYGLLRANESRRYFCIPARLIRAALFVAAIAANQDVGPDRGPVAGVLFRVRLVVQQLVDQLGLLVRLLARRETPRFLHRRNSAQHVQKDARHHSPSLAGGADTRLFSFQTRLICSLMNRTCGIPKSRETAGSPFFSAPITPGPHTIRVAIRPTTAVRRSDPKKPHAIFDSLL